MGIQCLADEYLQEMHPADATEKTDTVSYFLTNSIQSQQFFSCSFYKSYHADIVKWNISETDFSGCVQHIFCSVSQIALPKLFFRCQSQCLCSRKRIIFFTCAACFSYSKFPPIFSIHFFILVILFCWDQEWNNHLPQILLCLRIPLPLSCCCRYLSLDWSCLYIHCNHNPDQIPDPEEMKSSSGQKNIIPLSWSVQIFISRITR